MHVTSILNPEAFCPMVLGATGSVEHTHTNPE